MFYNMLRRASFVGEKKKEFDKISNSKKKMFFNSF